MTNCRDPRPLAGVPPWLVCFNAAMPELQLQPPHHARLTFEVGQGADHHNRGAARVTWHWSYKSVPEPAGLTAGVRRWSADGDRPQAAGDRRHPPDGGNGGRSEAGGGGKVRGTARTEDERRLVCRRPSSGSRGTDGPAGGVSRVDKTNRKYLKADPIPGVKP